MPADPPADPVRLQAGTRAFDNWLENVWHRANGSAEIAGSVARIIAKVRREGDAALLQLTREFDGWSPESPRSLKLDARSISAAARPLDDRSTEPLRRARDRIRNYHERQCAAQFSYVDALGNRVTRRVHPLRRVALYVPGGTACYPSSLLMAAVPAKLAGVAELVLVTPAREGKLPAWTAAAAQLVGIGEVWLLGGAQAAAAAAFGTGLFAKADKLAGPGNAYVVEAKRQLAGVIGIDLLAGPSEVVLVGDGTVPASWCAADLLAQAEHDAGARVAMISSSASELDGVAKQLREQLRGLPRAAIAAEALGKGALVLCSGAEESCALANGLAAEHVQLMCANARELAEKVTQCGSLFVGGLSGSPLGDYCAGPNHILPTGGSARFASALGVDSFQRSSSVFEASSSGAVELGGIAAAIATAEGLEGHARASLARCVDC